MADGNGAEQVPVLALTYGPSGAGKTTDMGYSFPRAIFVAARGATQPIRNVVGYEPIVEEARTISEATDLIIKWAERGGHHEAIVVDDFSFLAEQTFAQLDKKHSGFKLWGALRDTTLEFRNAARYANCHVILNCWERGPRTGNDGSRIRGGPSLSGKLPEQVPALCDLVLRCGQEPMRKPWPGVYRCHPDASYVMKDRFNVATAADPTPMNLGEILRATGYNISRHPDLPWQENVVAQVAAELLATDASQDTHIANQAYAGLLANSVPPMAARWTIRDAMDRAVISRALAARDATFIS